MPDAEEGLRGDPELEAAEAAAREAKPDAEDGDEEDEEMDPKDVAALEKKQRQLQKRGITFEAKGGAGKVGFAASWCGDGNDVSRELAFGEVPDPFDLGLPIAGNEGCWAGLRGREGRCQKRQQQGKGQGCQSQVKQQWVGCSYMDKKIHSQDY